jgi:hypothetical protein
LERSGLDEAAARDLRIDLRPPALPAPGGVGEPA